MERMMKRNCLKLMSFVGLAFCALAAVPQQVDASLIVTYRAEYDIVDSRGPFAGTIVFEKSFNDFFNLNEGFQYTEGDIVSISGNITNVQQVDPANNGVGLPGFLTRFTDRD